MTAASKVDDVIVVLGSGNHNEHELSFTALSRAEAGAKLYRSLVDSGKQVRVICTGGINGTTNCNGDKHHAEYVKDYLRELGVPDQDIIKDEVASTNTLQDAQHAKPVIEKYAPDAQIHVVTSKFHIPRAMITFRLLYNDTEKTRVKSCIAENEVRSDNPKFERIPFFHKALVHEDDLDDYRKTRYYNKKNSGALGFSRTDARRMDMRTLLTDEEKACVPSTQWLHR